MKYAVFIAFLFLVSMRATSQNKIAVYLELKASIVQGEVYIDSFETPNGIAADADSLIDYKSIEAITKKWHKPIKVINSLSPLGWLLVCVSTIPKDENYPYQTTHRLLYYFKKDYLVDTNQSK